MEFCRLEQIRKSVGSSSVRDSTRATSSFPWDDFLNTFLISCSPISQPYGRDGTTLRVQDDSGSHHVSSLETASTNIPWVLHQVTLDSDADNIQNQMTTAVGHVDQHYTRNNQPAQGSPEASRTLEVGRINTKDLQRESDNINAGCISCLLDESSELMTGNTTNNDPRTSQLHAVGNFDNTLQVLSSTPSVFGRRNKVSISCFFDDDDTKAGNEMKSSHRKGDIGFRAECQYSCLPVGRTNPRPLEVEPSRPAARTSLALKAAIPDDNPNRTGETESNTCGICHRKFSLHKTLLRHMRTVHQPKAFSCPQCRLQFIRKDTRDRHTAEKHSNELGLVTCLTCGRYIRKRAFKEHLNSNLCRDMRAVVAQQRLNTSKLKTVGEDGDPFLAALRMLNLFSQRPGTIEADSLSYLRLRLQLRSERAASELLQLKLKALKLVHERLCHPKALSKSTLR